MALPMDDTNATQSHIGLVYLLSVYISSLENAHLAELKMFLYTIQSFINKTTGKKGSREKPQGKVFRSEAVFEGLCNMPSVSLRMSHKAPAYTQSLSSSSSLKYALFFILGRLESSNVEVSPTACMNLIFSSSILACWNAMA